MYQVGRSPGDGLLIIPSNSWVKLDFILSNLPDYWILSGY